MATATYQHKSVHGVRPHGNRDVCRWVRKGVPLHSSKGSPKWGQGVNPFCKKGTPLRPEGLTLDDLGVQRTSAGGREAAKMVKYEARG